MKTKKERIAVSEEPEEWRRFKELAAKVMKAPPMPRRLTNPVKRREDVDARNDNGTGSL